MPRLVLFIFSISFLFLASCKSNKTHDELVEQFLENKKSLDSFVTVLQENSQLNAVFRMMPYMGLPDMEKAYPAEYKFLKKIGIKELTSHPCNKRTNWYFIITDWPDKYPVCLAYTSCEPDRTAKGFYEKDKYANEWWGLGDNWYMFRFVKIVDAKQ